MTDALFPIVGIGSSAGGVEALQSFFARMPAESGIAFVVVTHMASDFKTALPEVLGRHTAMPVRFAIENLKVEPNTVYVAPSGNILTIAKHKLHLTPTNLGERKKPIDIFISSLAEDSAEAAVAIILSGAGSDGTIGVKAVKEHGGLTMAQGRDSTGPLYNDMPDTAIASGAVDVVLPVEEMPARLADYAANLAELESKVDADAEQRTSEGLIARYQPIYRLLLKQVGHAFSGYKEKTFTRRVRRRVQVLQLNKLEDYIETLKKEPEEVTLLFRDLLISVTSFFRDPGAFDALAQLVVPTIFENKQPAHRVAPSPESASVTILRGVLKTPRPFRAARRCG